MMVQRAVAMQLLDMSHIDSTLTERAIHATLVAFDHSILAGFEEAGLPHIAKSPLTDTLDTEIHTL